MDIGRRILKAVRESESTGTIVDNYQGLTVSVKVMNNFTKYIKFIYLFHFTGFTFRDTWQYDDELWLKFINKALEALNFKDHSKILGEIT